MTSVDLMIAETVSPTLSFISSALRLVMTLSIKFEPTLTTTWAITPPSWSSTIFPSRRLRAESVMGKGYVEAFVCVHSKGGWGGRKVEIGFRWGGPGEWGVAVRGRK